MSPAEAATIDFPVLLQSMRGERQPTAVIYGPPLCGKSKFARALAESKGWKYLDIMSTFSEQVELSGMIDQVNVSTLKQIILTKAGNAEYVLCDELDFLFPLWGDLQPFKEMVRSLTNPIQPSVFAFFLQTRHDWDDWNLFTAGHQNRIIAFDTIKPL